MHDDGECLKLLNTYLGECLRQCVILKRRQREPGCVRERKRERKCGRERENKEIRQESIWSEKSHSFYFPFSSFLPKELFAECWIRKKQKNGIWLFSFFNSFLQQSRVEMTFKFSPNFRNRNWNFCILSPQNIVAHICLFAQTTKLNLTTTTRSRRSDFPETNRWKEK